MKDLIDSLLGTIKERVVNPFCGTYVVAWILVNYKPLLILFLSDVEIIARIDLMAKHSYEAWIIFIVPLFVTMVYLLLAPWIAFGITYMKNDPHRRSKELMIDHQLRIAERRDKLIRTETRKDQARQEIQLQFEEKKRDMEYSYKIREIELEDNRRDSHMHRRELEMQDRENRLKIKADEITAREKALEAEEVEQNKKLQSHQNELENVKQEIASKRSELKKMRKDILDLGNQQKDLERDLNMKTQRSFFVSGEYDKGSNKAIE